MVNYRVQVVIHTADNTAENFITNTWYCSAINVSKAEDFWLALKAGYNTVRPHLNPLIAQNGHDVKIYDLGDPEPRAPVSEFQWGLTTATSGSPLPTEVALCLSYQAAKMSGQPQARRRGRVYLGSLNAACVDAQGRPTSTVLTAWAKFGDDLLTASDASADWTWGQRSTMTVGLAPVANGWVDNEFDTQRRRGRKPTSRTVFN